MPEVAGRKKNKNKRVWKTIQTRYVWKRQTSKKKKWKDTEKIVPTIKKNKRK